VAPLQSRFFPFLLRHQGVFHEVILVNANSSALPIPRELLPRLRVVASSAGRGLQLDVGARAAQADWYLFLHSDTTLCGPWQNAITNHLAQRPNRPAVFRLTYDVRSSRAAFVGRWAGLRTRVFGLPYGDQGLLISAECYRAVGGFNRAYPLMEDVDMIRRLGGRGAFDVLDAAACTSFAKYEQEGWLRRGMRNGWYYSLYRLGMSPRDLYGRYYRSHR